jgi:hypothetical protein
MDKKEYTEEMVRLIIEGAIQEEREACLKICSEIKKDVTAKTNAKTILGHVIYYIKLRGKRVEA